ncbi:MAG: TrkH family potassium uptake protein, partial [Chloroflexi bacterium]|nr:TrkH family potassium uptake protein [Chloroflexota bacterium]
FNNAGFAIMDMTPSPFDWLVQLTLLGLIVAGGVSLFVVVDLIRGAFRLPLSLDTKLVLIASAVLLAGGAAAILLTESGGSGALAGMPLLQKVLSALFHSASARTAGLAMADLSAFAQPTQLLLVTIMFIGGSAGSTAGGVKVNSVALLVAATWSYVRGQTRLSVLRHPVHEEQVYRALAMVVLSLALVFVVTLLLGATEGPGLLPQLFEAVSAFSTTGFSLGITPTLSPLGKLLIVLTMLIGRIGPLALAFALSQRHRASQHRYVQEAVNLG